MLRDDQLIKPLRLPLPDQPYLHAVENFLFPKNLVPTVARLYDEMDFKSREERA